MNTRADAGAGLDRTVDSINGIGGAKARAFSKLGVFTLSDLISFFPRAYEDRTKEKNIAELMDGDRVCVRAAVTSAPNVARIRRGMELLKFRVADDFGQLDVTFFNQGYLRDRFVIGERYVFYGSVTALGARLQMTNPAFEPEASAGRVTGRIMPVYRVTPGLSQNVIMNSVRQGLDAMPDAMPDPLPQEVLSGFELCQARYAYENAHFPADIDALGKARRRLVFEELFVLACALGMLRGARAAEPGIALQGADASEFYASLPFEPTGAQRRAVQEAARDMTSGRLMNRLVQGDVGSGKTLVAAACVWLAHRSGRQCAFMAPTEILAEQHVGTLTALLAPFGINVVKLTGSMTAKEKRAALAAIADGSCDLAVGTHALLSESVAFRDLALVVTDEQHRFGVSQRASLANKGGRPHILVMSATPIPRTLALMLYGDLDVSVIDELPPGRQRVGTFAVDGSYRPRLNNFIRRLTGEGRQVFVVCPMIEENDELPPGLKSAEEHAAALTAEFPGLRVACVHGRMKARDKDAVMSAFAAGDIDVLVSTTVVEVGVDVPNAALMIVENAERFGLSQLHQLRGRVGRGEHKSYCVLVSDAKGEEARARLEAMTKTNDGFKISEQDLRIRGPGDFFGSRQHGLPEMHIADLGADMTVLQKAQNAATELLENDPTLSRPEHAALRARAAAMTDAAGGRFN